MRVFRLLLPVAAIAAVFAYASVTAPRTEAETPIVALEAKVVPITKPSTVRTFQTYDFARRKTVTTGWRVVNSTGNCCENFLTSSAAGRIYDFGGSYLNYTDDRGLTWNSVQPVEPLYNGEGAVTIAPGGDVVGVEWDPYTGDHLLTFKYDAALGKWLYNEAPLHEPFYDREWIAVVPGPITLDGQTLPYISIIKGAYPSKELWLVSKDGVNYFEASSKFVDSTLNSARQGWLLTSATPDFDWSQPNTNTGITAIGDGAALGAPDWPNDDTAWALLDRADREWHGFSFADGSAPVGRYLVDSAGRLHNVVPGDGAFTYRISSDGGRTWRSVELPVPAGYSALEWDFRANKAVGVGAFVVQAQNDETGNSRYLAYRLDIRKAAPVLLKRYDVGLGDAGAAAGVGNDVRFDFNTVAILPDGKLAVSFIDSQTITPSATNPTRITPAVAIEQ